MTVRARPHLHYAPVPEGVYFSGPGAQFVIGGPALLFHVADVCVPLLEAGTTEDELVAALGSERARPVVRKIVAELRSRGLMLDLDALTVPEPPAEVRDRYPEALAHLETDCDDPYAVFERLRATGVLLCGPADAVLPAARGLHRAGVTALTLATADADAVAPTAARLKLPVVPVTAGSPLPAADRLPARPDAAVVCLGTDGSAAVPPDALAALLPAGAPVVPVRWDALIALVGPAGRDRETLPRSAAFARRAGHWAAAEAAGPAPHPTTAVLAGALAGQLLFDTLAGIAQPGEAHVVHGEELISERVSVAAAVTGAAAAGTGSAAGGSTAGTGTAAETGSDAGDGAAERPLTAAPTGDAGPVPPPTPEEAVEAVTALTARWLGPHALLPGDELPQLPLALREIADRDGGDAGLVAWAADQRTATVAVALAALRAACPGPGTGAAGLTEEHWLLDGALRLLAEAAEPYATGATDRPAARTVPLLRALADEGAADPTVTLLRHPGLDWTLAEARTADGPLPAAGLSWGRDEEEAVHGALATVLARRQAHRTPGPGEVPPGVHTDALLFADASLLAALRKQVVEAAADAGVRYVGTARRPDAVTGACPLWSGDVRTVPLTEEPADD